MEPESGGCFWEQQVQIKERRGKTAVACRGELWWMCINWHLVREPLQSLSSVPETASLPSLAKLIQPLPKTLMNQNYQTDVQYYTVSAGHRQGFNQRKTGGMHQRSFTEKRPMFKGGGGHKDL